MATSLSDLLRSLMYCKSCGGVTHYSEDLVVGDELVCESCGQTILLEVELLLGDCS